MDRVVATFRNAHLGRIQQPDYDPEFNSLPWFIAGFHSTDLSEGQWSFPLNSRTRARQLADGSVLVLLRLLDLASPLAAPSGWLAERHRPVCVQVERHRSAYRGRQQGNVQIGLCR